MNYLELPLWAWIDIALLFIIILLTWRRDKPRDTFWEDFIQGDPRMEARVVQEAWEAHQAAIQSHARHPSEFKGINDSSSPSVRKEDHGKEFS